MKIDVKFLIFLVIIIFMIGFYSGKFYESSKIPMVTEYACSDKKTVGVQYYDEKVHIGLSDGREYTLPQAVSASGARYANESGSLVFWNKGDGVFLQEGSLVTYSNCLKAGI
jgi:membrane-bound inhibitor of C-type lysozyme